VALRALLPDRIGEGRVRKRVGLAVEAEDDAARPRRGVGGSEGRGERAEEEKKRTRAMGTVTTPPGGGRFSQSSTQPSARKPVSVRAKVKPTKLPVTMSTSPSPS
jgi:hypothetical protein